MDTATTRIRAWVLIESSNPKKIADQIWSHDDRIDGHIVIVRTDIVKGGKYDLVVPIDMHPYGEEDVYRFLKKYCEPDKYHIAVVDDHIPPPPQNASGFITDSELVDGEKKDGVRPGRQDNSPGFNPWG